MNSMLFEANYEKVNGPLKWFGGKGAFHGKLAEWIISLMPRHTHYVEPYFGGGSVLLAKDPEGISEVVNDKHGELINFWKVLQDEQAFARLERILQATPFAEDEFKAAAVPADDPIQRAARFFVRCRQSRGGQFKCFATLIRSRTRRGMQDHVSAWWNAIEGLPEVHNRLGRVVILNHDALDVIRQQDGAEVCFYCDPPYVHESRESADVYAHEMNRSDHEELLRVLAGIKGRFLLSGYPSRLYDVAADRYGWRRHEFQIVNNASSKEEKDVETECVWTNS